MTFIRHFSLGILFRIVFYFYLEQDLALHSLCQGQEEELEQVNAP